MILVGAFFALYFTVLQPNENSVAINSTNKEGTDYENIGELLNDKTTAKGDKPFNGTILNKLITKIDSTATCVSDLASKVTSTSGKTATDIRNNNDGKSLVVKLGDLDWIVTYVTLDSTSSNVIATLWLSNNHQTAWGWDGTTVGKTALTNPTNVGSYCAIINGGLYSDWSANWYCDYNATGINYPSNMYGTSYIRTETLNNPTNRYVATGTNNTTTDVTLDKTTWETQQTAIYDPNTGSGHPFALFTVESYGLTSHIAKPSQMKWMESEKSYPNESTNADKLYSGKTDCYNWINDYLWLPSLSETGYNTNKTGIWELNNAERSTYDGSTISSSSSLKAGSNNDSTSAYVCSWSRSADYYGAYYSSSLNPAGGDYSGGIVSGARAVRPALLLNLSSILSVATVTLDKQDGSVGSDTIHLIEKDTTLPTIVPPTRTGYNFAGYYTEQNGGGTLVYNADGTPALSVSTSVENKTIYAKWVDINITLDNQGATTSGTTSLIATYNEELPEIDPPTKTGYLFLGYYTDTNGNGTQVYNSDGTPAITVSTFTQNTTLYADWAQNTSTITFDDNGATTSGSLSSISIDYGATLPNVTAPEKTGSTFCGYYAWGELGYETLIYKADGTPAVAKSTFKYDTTLYAVWSPVSLYDYIKSDFEYKLTNPYTVRNSASVNWTAVAPENSADLPKNAGVTGGYIKSTNEGKSSSYSGFAITFNATCSARLTVSYLVSSEKNCDYLMIYSNGTDILGSGVATRGGTANTTFTVVTKDITSGDNVLEFYYRKDSSTNEGDDCVYISLITIEKLYTITLDNQDASSTGTTSVSVTNGSAMPNITVPTKTGYAFGGYFTETNGSGTKIYNTDGTPAIEVSTFAEDTTLYAYWLPQITVNANISIGIDNLTGAGVYAVGSSAVLGVYAVSGYNFLHWLKDGLEFDGNDANPLKITVSCVATYTAVFEKAGVNIEEFMVASTKGGVAYVVGQDASELEDDDTFVVMTKPCVVGYKFVGWYLDNDRETKISDQTSFRVTKSVAYKHVLVAVYEVIVNEHVNYELNNM